MQTYHEVEYEVMVPVICGEISVQYTVERSALFCRKLSVQYAVDLGALVGREISVQYTKELITRVLEKHVF